MSSMDRYFLASAAETYGVTIPDYLAEAKALLDAATKYRIEVEALEQPTLAGITPKTIGVKVDAVLAFAQRDERLRLASQVENTADGLLTDAYARFQQVLLVELAKPFDDAAEAYMTVYDNPDPGVTQDPAIVLQLGELVRLRDQMAGRVGDATPTHSGADLPTRCAVLPYKDVLAVKVPHRTHALGRGELPWLNAMLSIEGVRLKWQTPTQQAAQVDAMPVHYPAKV